MRDTLVDVDKNTLSKGNRVRGSVMEEGKVGLWEGSRS
jgi:hypothetical protein